MNTHAQHAGMRPQRANVANEDHAINRDDLRHGDEDPVYERAPAPRAHVEMHDDQHALDRMTDEGCPHC